VRYAAAALGLVLFLTLVGCQDEPPAGPTTQEYAAERDRLAAQIKKHQARPEKAKAKPQPMALAEGDPTQANFATVSTGFTYDPTGKRDPFRSYRWERQARLSESATRGPLEQFDLGQLSVVAVVWHTDKARALIEDPSGRAYVVSEGTAVGKNQGRVIHIDDNLVLVKETYVNFEGEETTKDVELRIRRSQGG
jgi:type IV pilus assembly protein PilP